jgi:hypothetical protein
MNKSESCKELATSLAKAQAEMKNPGLDKTNPHFKSKFASLAGVRDSVVPVLAKHGISVVQSLEHSDHGIACETMLLHSSGEWLSGTLVLPVSKEDAQGYGSAATYARRYALMSFAGVVGDEDDDGNAASKHKTPAEAISRANVKPAGGVMDSLSADDQTQCRLVASIVLDAWDNGKQDMAVNNWKEHARALGQDERVAAWDLLPSNVRSHIKKVLAQSGVDSKGVLQP